MTADVPAPDPADVVDVEALRELLAKATPGPWREGYGRGIVTGGGPHPREILSAENSDDPDWPDAQLVIWEADVCLIVAAVNALRPLLKIAEQRERAMARAEKWEQLADRLVDEHERMTLVSCAADLREALGLREPVRE